MKLEYSSFKLITIDIKEDENEFQQVFLAGGLTFICVTHFDTDTASDTFNHWVCTLDIVSDTEDVPERSFVLYPNTIHFEGDSLYTVAITSELEEIGHDDLQNVIITIGVPTDE